MSGQFVIEWAAASDVGKQRDHNEDSYLADEDEGLFVVADGMGGHNSGEEASLRAVEGIYRYMTELRYDPDQASRYGRAEGLPGPARDLVTAIRYANERIFVEALKEPEKEGMGTTVVAAFWNGEHLTLAWVGDSRIYRFRERTLEQITVDHSLLNHLLATGQVTPETAHTVKKGNVIVRALGLKDTVNVDVRMEVLRNGDLYLLCSDGLTDMVDDQIIAQILYESVNGDMDLACRKLVHMANAGGGVDNITVCMMRALQDSVVV